jgi:uncharacterized protein (TIGR02217 family)
VSFNEIEFPRGIGFHIVGGPTFLTTVNQALSGMEQRNQNWQSARAKWTISLTTPPLDQYSGTQQSFIDTVSAFFLNMAGKANSFRFFDPVDNTITNQIIGVGNGVLTTFQVVKSYTLGANTYVRNIVKPITSSVINYEGLYLTNTFSFRDTSGPLYGWSLDYTTGLVTFPSPIADGQVIYANGQFDYPVRFDVDALPMQIEESNVTGGFPIITIKSLPIIEVLPPNY